MDCLIQLELIRLRISTLDCFIPVKRMKRDLSKKKSRQKRDSPQLQSDLSRIEHYLQKHEEYNDVKIMIFVLAKQLRAGESTTEQKNKIRSTTDIKLVYLHLNEKRVEKKLSKERKKERKELMGIKEFSAVPLKSQ